MMTDTLQIGKLLSAGQHKLNFFVTRNKSKREFSPANNKSKLQRHAQNA